MPSLATLMIDESNADIQLEVWLDTLRDRRVATETKLHPAAGEAII